MTSSHPLPTLCQWFVRLTSALDRRSALRLAWLFLGRERPPKLSVRKVVLRANIRGGLGVSSLRGLDTMAHASGWPRRARGAFCPIFGRSAGRVPCRDSEPGRGQVVVAQR